jgi:hypothetical protein
MANGRAGSRPGQNLWHDDFVAVPVLIIVAICAVLAAVVLVAAGRWGEMPAAERADYAPLDLGPVTATDVVLLRPPTALWGYNQQATDEALERIAGAIRDRDVRIIALEQLVTDLTRETVPPVLLGSPYAGARHARPALTAGTLPAGTLPESRPAESGQPETGPLGAPAADWPQQGPVSPYLPPWAGPGDSPGSPSSTGPGSVPPEVSHD